MTLFRLALTAVFVATALPTQVSAQQVPEIPMPGLNDVARAQMTPQGPVIYYNPIICQQLGPLACEFFRAHEYGHILLGHLQGSALPPDAEMQADCFAASHVPPQILQAGIQAFQTQGMGGDAQHGTGFQRAQRIYDMATTGNCHW